MSNPRPATAPTTQQAAAITARGVSVVVSSGAGCGKTHVLTERYVSHLASDGVGVGEVVAITFTDRAAREMRGRIRAVIARRREAEPAGPWAGHLRDLETAPIQTIHSFCGNLLRQYAVAAGLDPRFDVLEEVLADNLRADALRETLHSLLTSESPAGNDLRKLIVLYGWSTTQNAIRELMRESDFAAWDRWLKRSPTEIAAHWLDDERAALLPVWVDYLLAASPKVAHLVNLFQSVPCVGPEMQANVARVLEGLSQLASAPDLAAAIKELCECAKVGRERAKAWPDADVYEIVKDAMADFRSALPGLFELFGTNSAGVETAAAVGQRFLRVAWAVAEAYQQRKARAGVMDFQDMLVMGRDLVRDNPDVQADLQSRYRYLLLDEMQDTDPVQMELIERLCGVGIPHEKLFAVGDAKQSIYRFRGADVSLFEGLRDSVPPAGRLPLTLNFRSQPDVLKFVNALCSRRFVGYEPLEASHPQLHTLPCTEFLWAVPSADDGPKESADDRRVREADAIARRIVAILDKDEERVFDPETRALRAARPGDIALLFRSMSNVGIYEAALRRHGLDYYLVGGRAFFAQQEVYDLLNLLRTLENPDDSIALAGTLRSPFGCLSDEALLLIGIRREGLWNGLGNADVRATLPDDQRARAVRIHGLIEKWRGSKDRLSISRLIGMAVADTGYDAALQFEILGDRKLANLWKLMEVARSFDRSGLFGLPDFIARLADSVTNQPREEEAATQPDNADVIKIMSIHQAKGLEFPVVLVPDIAAAGRGGRHGSARWDRRLGCLAAPPTDDDPPPFPDFPHRLGLAVEAVAEWHEELRVLYVACTRARDLLVLSAGLAERFPTGTPDSLPVPVKGSNAWMLALGERFNLRSGSCLDQSILMNNSPRIKVREIEPEAELAVPLRSSTASPGT